VHGVVLVNTTESILRNVDRRLVGRIVSIGIGSRLVPSVDVDNAAGATAIARHLVDSGRRRIVMVTGPRWLPCTRPAVGAYTRVMQDAGLPVRTVVGDFTEPSGRAAAATALRRWPGLDAVFAVCDATALGVVAELRSRTIGVPADVAVAGFDDIAFAEFSKLTTATHPVEAIAEAASELVLASWQVRPPNLVFPSELVLRESA
jgi:DNA-binding LacI/PurR family transcriptional regulator